MEHINGKTYDEIIDEMCLMTLKEKCRNTLFPFYNYEFVICYRLYEFILEQCKKDIVITNSADHPIPSIFGIPIRIDRVNPDVCYLYKNVPMKIERRINDD